MNGERNTIKQINKLIVILVFICAAMSSLSQEKFVVRGKVVDAASGKTIESVNIQIRDTYKGATTSMEGKFRFAVDNLPITLVFSHISYETRTIQVTAFDAKDVIIVKMFTRINLMKEALVTSQHKFASAENVITVLDFNFIDDNILILLYNHTKKAHELVLTGPLFDTIACSGKYTEKKKPQYLFRDCLGECHIYDTEFARQVVVRDSIIFLMFTHSTDKFHTTLDECLFETKNYVVFEHPLNEYIQEFYCIHKEKEERRIILSSNEMEKAREMHDEINWIIAHADIYGDVGAAIRFEREIMFRPAYKVLKKI